MQIIKRDSRIKPFDGSRIEKALDNAFAEVYSELDYSSKMNEALSNIEEVIFGLNVDVISVEEVQDIVVDELSKVDKKVARAYNDYREERQKIRESNTDTYKKIDKVLKCSDIVNSNANIDEASFGGRKFEVAGIVMKKVALEQIVSKDVAKAHLENRGYLHDLDSYAIGMHNCSFLDIEHLLKNGFSTRNGDVRGANSLSTAMQQIAVIFQVQSQEQFGGTGTAHIDYDLEPFVNISFRKHLSNALYYLNNEEVDYKNLPQEDNIENLDNLKNKYDEKVIKYTLRELEKEGIQSAQGLYHNLNTLESRPGSQVPFTSINFGRRESNAGRLVSKWLLKASLDGIGKFHRTSIFPISIFQYKKGVNDKVGTPNYDLKKLAIESMSKRIYPNWVNCNWSNNVEDDNNPDSVMATMG